jgi:hypothetical protein
MRGHLITTLSWSAIEFRFVPMTKVWLLGDSILEAGFRVLMNPWLLLGFGDL